MIRYARKDEVWTDQGPRPARVRASCTVRADDSFVLAYDAADPDQLRTFLRNRVDRTHYLDMVPVINAALAAKIQERAAEAPFRQMTVGMLMQDTGVPVDEAQEAVVGLVDWWKFANQVHRPLTGRGAEADAKAAREILAEFHRRRRTDHGRIPDEVVETVAARHPGSLLIAQTHAGHLIVLTAQADGPYVTEHSYTRRGLPRYSRPWVLPGARPNRWTTLRSTPRWETWDRGATLAEHLSGPEREALAEQAALLARAEFPGREIAAVTLQGTHAVIAWTVSSWGRADEDRPATGTLEPVMVEGYGFDWRRDRSQQPVAGPSRPYGQRAWDQKGNRRPWEASWGQVATVLSVDADLVERADAAHARHQAVARRRDAIREAARTAYRTAETIWNERQEKDAHDAFLAEYGEPSLWEGHRKTITLEPMPEPPGQTGSSRLLGTTWFTALTTLIEAGTDLSDYTLGQALEAQGLTGIPAELHT
ncbi:hypothetical protein, partial [Streptomyces sp. NPDC127574]|uniref:hypothetical protein n=1 Tax=Streptomyces sp. NPDC127574 TaxID=3345401 RepID=UPI00363EBFB0